MARAKGSTLTNRLKYIEAKGTPEQKEKIIALLDPEFQRIIKTGILPVGWYPFDYFNDLLVKIDQVMGKGDLALTEDVGRFAGELACTGIYKMFFKVGSVEFVIKHASRFWEQLFDSGKLEVIIEAPHKARMTVTDFDVATQALCLSLKGWSQVLMELAGGKNVKLTIIHWPSAQNPMMEYKAEWD